MLKANQLIRDPPCDSYETCQESKGRGLLQLVKRKINCPVLYVAWVVLHRNRHIGASERRQLIPHVRFQVPFLGPESQLKSGFACAGLLCTPPSFRYRVNYIG